ncbi:hypothetical protein V5O48_000649 [Marasmius crinis-equi]|uniref:Formamidopyrimidine-DNA glycosylase catalytic domain-containing protein n=1 Tax=Marasmius crinis-equi TaxID=585013 RepID=A0ABR3G1R0_9AGAR
MQCCSDVVYDGNDAFQDGPRDETNVRKKIDEDTVQMERGGQGPVTSQQMENSLIFPHSNKLGARDDSASINHILIVTPWFTLSQKSNVDAAEDTIVFAETSSQEFASALTGRTITGVHRYGKVFYIVLDGEGKMPVLHFGMTGMLQVRGEPPMYYKEAPRKTSTEWPPRFMKYAHKFNIHLQDEETGEITELAFLDARRLGRIRLRASPATEPPISDLGFDPILSMPTLDDFSSLTLKRSCPIKALLLDQSFSAGVGNWVADEVLYHARIHPQQSSNTLSSDQLEALHQALPDICQTAIAVDADATKFPGKGKGPKKTEGLKLPDGTPATIKWMTVGGRTSAIVSELQILNVSGAGPSRPRRRKNVKVENDGSESELTPMEDDHDSKPETNVTKRQRVSKAKSTTTRGKATQSKSANVGKDDPDSDLTPLEDEQDSEVGMRSPKRRRTKKEEISKSEVHGFDDSLDIEESTTLAEEHKPTKGSVRSVFLAVR